MARALFGPNGQRQILLDHLPTLTTPTLVVWGGCDYVLPAHHAQTAVNLLPNGRLSVFPDCGHLPHVEHPDRFAAVLSDWLTEHRDLPDNTPSTDSRTSNRRRRRRRTTMASTRTAHRMTSTGRAAAPADVAYVTSAAHPPASGPTAARPATTISAPTPSSRWRELLVTQLPVRRGDTVLDVGCGTGLCLPMLQRKIGPTGTIVGIDASEQMLQLAAARVAEHGWDNVRLIAAPVATAPIDGAADAALFCAVHDVMQSRRPWTTSFDHLRPGAPVAATGGKWPGPWMWPYAHGSPNCTPRSSPTSPASTSPGDYWPNTFPTCASANSPSAPDTSPSATPQAEPDRTHDDDTQ